MSVAASTSPRPPSSPPPSISSPTTTTTNAHPVPPAASNSIFSSSSPSSSPPSLAINNNNATSNSIHPQHFHSTLPTAETQRHVEEARAAVVASMGNMVDRELQSRASVLHENARALDRQEQDVIKATDALRKEREKLGREVDSAARKLKEVGNVQNWAEVLERQFLVIEETVRLANGGREVGPDGDDSDGVSSSGECSCSDCGKDDIGEDRWEPQRGGEEEGDGKADMNGKGKDSGGEDSKIKNDGAGIVSLDTDGAANMAWSDTSRSLNEPESSTGTGMAKGSETASLSTNP